MKKIFIVVFIVLCAIFLGCHYDDDSSYINLEIQDAIVFENNQNYVVGDTIFFELNFSRYLDEAGFDNKLDIFESSGADSFFYDFSLNKFSEQAGGFRYIDVADEFIFTEKGTVTGFGGASADLNQEKTLYESRVGLILVETGSFQLDLDFYSLRSSGYSEDKVQISIQHLFTDNPPNFEFMVSE